MVATFWWDKAGADPGSANGDPFKAILGVTGRLDAQTKPGRGVQGGYLEKSELTHKLIYTPIETEVDMGGGKQIRRKLSEMLPSKAAVPRHRDILIPAGYCLFMHGKRREMQEALKADMDLGLRALVRFTEKLELRWLRYMPAMQTDLARTVLGIGGLDTYWGKPLTADMTDMAPEWRPGVERDDRGWEPGRVYGLQGYDPPKGGLFAAATLQDLHEYLDRSYLG